MENLGSGNELSDARRVQSQEVGLVDSIEGSPDLVHFLRTEAVQQHRRNIVVTRALIGLATIILVVVINSVIPRIWPLIIIITISRS